MDMMANWRHSENWQRSGTGFLVKVNHHTVADSDQDGAINRWCVYVYIYPTHPHFAKFIGLDMWQEATSALRLHGGCSYLRAHLDGKTKEITSYEVGCDYNHLHDGPYALCAEAGAAYSVFQDADELFDQMERLAKP